MYRFQFLRTERTNERQERASSRTGPLRPQSQPSHHPPTASCTAHEGCNRSTSTSFCLHPHPDPAHSTHTRPPLSFHAPPVCRPTPMLRPRERAAAATTHPTRAFSQPSERLSTRQRAKHERDQHKRELLSMRESAKHEKRGLLLSA